MKEIVTVQVGDFANFVGSHFWNFQDELLGLAGDPSADSVFKNQDLNMGVLYRTGETQQGIPSYTPRLVSINLRGTLGSMSALGTLYTEVASTTPDVVTWTGRVSTQASEPFKRNLFLQRLYEEEDNSNIVNEIPGSNNGSQSEYEDKDIIECLENGVQFWTDYSKVHYHPRSLYELHGVWTDVQEFNNYGIGRDSFSWAAQGEDISDRLRFFVEECDHIQGFQFVVDDSGGFSAVAAEFLENIVDEYTNIPVLLYAVQGSSGSRTNLQSRKRTVSEDLHDAISFSRLSSYCKLIVPVGLPSLSKSKASRFLHIEDGKHFHSSAVYAAALHSISLPFRMFPVGPTADACSISGAVDIHGVVQILSGQGRQNMVSVLDVAMPAPALTGGQNELSLLENLQPLTPQTADVEDMLAIEHMTVHGALSSEGHRASVGEVKASVDGAFRCANTRPMFCHLSVALCPLPIPLPFPSIFGNNVGQQGEVTGARTTNSSPKGSLDIHCVPMAARLRSSSTVLPLLESKLRNLHRFGIQRGAAGAELLRSWGFGMEELVEMEEMLSKMVAALRPPQLTSDSD
ncbi:unnamed protein product [Sphenostylis stenocarpa]|uniref:Protein misato homolog 1 n=1 Tax=Sphenostylis stenocarpa TaxID=92480 RepID=A0AA86S753_9FABA|nr:unnamed protein product [Sphenostylis stenocarpa]